MLCNRQELLKVDPILSEAGPVKKVSPHHLHRRQVIQTMMKPLMILDGSTPTIHGSRINRPSDAWRAPTIGACDVNPIPSIQPGSVSIGYH